ncbi:hypothetical protein ACFYSH_07955 [Streptomyces sp. NPDC005791]|uniref:hypothetical protein n=1 Tax=Streptomyces sp. NPDC005791 TaxID=3364732 RepID=UPI00369129B1
MEFASGDFAVVRKWTSKNDKTDTVSERVIMYSAVDVEEWLHRHRTVPRRDA